ncbi:hypothetical protein U9M48_031020 [Paspalum notatum var. saurae]|uniref:C2H2-type domain-containing protein n=1 Tax=Paspalum notatum var. saurae TaxID=547442 RepID=A0AAQ3U1Y6_PASNO
MASSRDHGGHGLKQLPACWTPGHNFSLAGCFSWPSQRSPPPPSSSYTCGYCRREFRSAQALGGHMNVHRRDRARLRQCCTAAHPASLPVPAGPGTMTHHQQHRSAAPLPNLNFSPPHCASAAAAAEPVIYSFFTTTTSAAAAAVTKAAALEVSLELGIGVCGGSGGRGGVVDADDGLDLELRLGCAWE